MHSWFDRRPVPATRRELHYGRMLRCFVERPKSVHQMLERAVALPAHGTAVICDDRSVNYAQLNALVGEVAGGLRSLGVKKGDRVAILLGNSIEFVVVLFAIARLGAVSVPLNIRHQLAENRHILDDCAAKVVVHEGYLSDRIPTPGAPMGAKHAVGIR
jgi:long-chain acyl-CoA synthetase